MPEILLHSGLSLLEARRVADAAGMFLVTDGHTVVVAPQVLPGWWEVPLTLRRTPPPFQKPDHAAPAQAAA